MRRKLIFIFSSLCVISAFISVYVIYSIEKATTSFESLIQLHKIADMREQMLDEIEVVQADLNLKQTRHARDFSRLVVHVSNMTESIESCFDCHHSEGVVSKLNSLQQSAGMYKAALSRVYTMRANMTRLMQEEDNAYLIGENLIREVEEMLIFTNRNLEFRTQNILKSVNRSKDLLLVFTIFAPIVIIALVWWFYMKFTIPVSRLMAATSHLKSGDLDYQIEKLDDEFGELAQSFNDMTRSLKEVMQTMVRAEEMVLMGEMSSRLAHEIKNPITGIKLAAELIRDEGELKGEHKDLLFKTIEQIKGIEKLMKGLLNFAKPPAPEMEKEDFNVIIETALSTVEMLIQKRTEAEGADNKIKVVRDLGQDLPAIMTDASQVRQILLNLMLNAVDAMPGGGAMTVRSLKDPHRDSLVVEITDTGDGIEPELHEMIFLPFYSTKTRGTGLGLAIVKKLTVMLGGELSFTSKAKEGTAFSVSLPVAPLKGDEQP